MNLKQSIFYLIIGLTLLSCKKNEIGPNFDEVEEPKAALTELILNADKRYTTYIQGLDITNTEEIAYTNAYVTINELSLYPGATTSWDVGDTLWISQQTFDFEVTAVDPSITNTYTLTLTRDEGMQIAPNTNLEQHSSYELFPSDVYVEANQITQDFDLGYMTGYADFDEDGFTDVLLAGLNFQSEEFSKFYLYRGNGSASFTDACECGGSCSGYQCDAFQLETNAFPNEFEGMQHPRKILIGDYNNDGKTDAFVLGHGIDVDPFPGESPVLLINNGNDFTPHRFTEHKAFDHGGSSADIDNDGDVDIFIVNPGKSIFLINDGQANFNITTDRIDDFFLDDTKGYFTAELIDIDEDGYMDLLLGGHEYDGAGTYILWGNSYGKYFQELSTQLPTVVDYQIVIDIDAEDIDNDGDRDIILLRVSGGGSIDHRYYIQVLENNGDNSFIDKSEMRITENEGPAGPIWLHLQDLDNDGDFDIYLQRESDDDIKLFNDGSGNFLK